MMTTGVAVVGGVVGAEPSPFSSLAVCFAGLLGAVCGLAGTEMAREGLSGVRIIDWSGGMLKADPSSTAIGSAVSGLSLSAESGASAGSPAFGAVFSSKFD